MKNKSNFKEVVMLLMCIFILNAVCTPVKATTNFNNQKQIVLEWFGNVINQTDKANKVTINQKTYGYISEDETINSLGEAIASLYIEELNLNSEDILSIDLNLNIDFQNETVKKEEIQSLDIIAKEIYKDKLNNNLQIDVKTIEEEKAPIESETKYKQSSELYMGQTREVEGKKGVKNVTKVVTYSLTNDIEELILEEEVIQASTANVVYEGSKNPYFDKIAFLKVPVSKNVITSYFGMRWNKLHKGIDFAGSVGDSVCAAVDGTVSYSAYNNGGYGNLIIIDHANNMKSYYAHLDTRNVKVGDEVKKGSQIGTLGNTGRSTGPHLHFELRINNEPVDPLEYLED